MTMTATEGPDATQSAWRLGLLVWDTIADLRTGYAEPDKEALRKAANDLLSAEDVREAPKYAIYLAHVLLEWLSGLFPDSYKRLERASIAYEKARIK